LHRKRGDNKKVGKLGGHKTRVKKKEAQKTGHAANKN